MALPKRADAVAPMATCIKTNSDARLLTILKITCENNQNLETDDENNIVITF